MTGPIRVGRERKGRAGKTVTVAGPLPLSRADARVLARQLKRELGSGGTLQDAGAGAPAVLEIQGDHVDRLLAALVRRGYAAVRVGG